MKSLVAVCFVGAMLASSVAQADTADAYDAVVTTDGEKPVAAVFKKCKEKKVLDEVATQPHIRLRTCAVWDEKKTLYAFKVRVLNLGPELAWVQVDTARVALLPGQVFVRTTPYDAGYDHVWVSSDPGKTTRVHVFGTTHAGQWAE